MNKGWKVLQETNWSHFSHAYGSATDTPHHLLAFIQGDMKEQEAAIEHLFSAIIHQGSPWTATAKVAVVLAGFLQDPKQEEKLKPWYKSLMSFFAEIAAFINITANQQQEQLEMMAQYLVEPVMEPEDDLGRLEEEEEKISNALYTRVVLACREIIPVLVDIFQKGFTYQNEEVQMQAAVGLVDIVKSGYGQQSIKQIQQQLMDIAQAATSFEQRSCLVLLLGDLGVSTQLFLQDPSLPVRMCAMLAPALANQEPINRQLIQMIADYAEQIDTWFKKHPQFTGHPHFYIVARLLERVQDFDKLLPAAISLVNIATKWSVDHDVGPLLVAAFPQSDGRIQSEAQREFLRALVNRLELWDPTYGNCYRWFREAGLPYDRKACAQRIIEFSQTSS